MLNFIIKLNGSYAIRIAVNIVFRTPFVAHEPVLMHFIIHFLGFVDYLSQN